MYVKYIFNSKTVFLLGSGWTTTIGRAAVIDQMSQK